VKKQEIMEPFSFYLFLGKIFSGILTIRLRGWLVMKFSQYFWLDLIKTKELMTSFLKVL